MAEQDRRKAAPERLTRDWVERTALAYLNRFDSSTSNLKQVLLRRVRRLARQGTDTRDAERFIDETLARYRDSGLLNDVRFAAALARSLRDKGVSRRAMEQRLITRGVARDTVSGVLEELDVSTAGAELEAARRYVKRRRLGPYRSKTDARSRQKDLAALARAGFDRDTALAALQLERDGDEF